MKRKRGLWQSLEGLPTQAALLCVWQDELGTEFDLARRFLQPTDERSSWHPCTNPFPCECWHEVVVHAPDRIVAACRCEPGDCEVIRLEAKDLVIYALDRRRLDEAVRRALGFEPGEPASNGSGPGTRQIGIFGPVHSPVYFHSPWDADAFARELHGLLALRTAPFILLTPTRTHFSPEIDAALKQHGCVSIPLSVTLSLAEPGRFVVSRPIEPILAEFTRGLTEGRNTGAVLEGIHREIVAVRTDFRDLRAAKQRLEQMLSEGLFAFTRKVDAASFKVFCTILAEGDVAKASRKLALGDSTMRDLLGQWNGQGKAYQAMLDLVRWRKKVGRKETVPLNDAIWHENAPMADYPALLADVLDGLLSMTEGDWQERCEELAELLRPHVPR